MIWLVKIKKIEKIENKTSPQSRRVIVKEGKTMEDY